MKYRPDVDGLRAIAVVSVVIFHLHESWLPGGFLGVDIFFVLSGFLITGILRREMEDGRFSVGQFYHRRVKRILPALLAVLSLTTVFSAMILLPLDLIGYGKSIFATLFFFANIYFWRDTNYFSQLASEKPLLHMWSLSVEEQFYIFFPILLLLLIRWLGKNTYLMLGALMLISLGTHIGLTYIGGASPAFYLLPSRAWELLAGAVLAFLPAENFGKRIRQIVAFISLAVLLLGIIFPIERYFPLLPSGLPVVLATCMFIWINQNVLSAPGKLIASRPLVLTGLISYSLYLWHWPVVVLAKYYLIRELTIAETAVATVLMVGLSVLSWKYVENPARSKSISAKRLYGSVIATSLLLLICAALFIGTKGLPGRLSADAAAINASVGTHYRCEVTNYLRLGSNRACGMNLASGDPRDASVVLLGNSHAQMYAPVWQEILKDDNNRQGLLVPLNGCLPMPSININAECFDAAKANLQELLKLPRVKLVILAFNWDFDDRALYDESYNEVAERKNVRLIGAVDQLIATLRSAGKQVILVGPIAEPGWNVASEIGRYLAYDRNFVRKTFMDNAHFRTKYGAIFAHFERDDKLLFVRADKVQCSGGKCTYIFGNQSLFSDSNHIAQGQLWRFRQLFGLAYQKIK